MELYEKVQAYFEPKRTETLRDEARPFIGKLMTFEALWLIDEEDGGPYVGQWAMRACAENGLDWLPLGWVPEEDIRILTPNAQAVRPAEGGSERA
jgi:hypothetical protein